ncbi:flagellar hook protein FlgE [Ruegeria sp. TM1040]|jgi:flagellar hook protein FlgE|uniref:flagellar hook protein FlgE n=1 Tax=Rhodobacterales TaxID=204455 RepID=UPI0000462A4C|nr:flagellar hook-basal body complex protein [Ruegeria sp. TM1040]ABF65671.1 Flagellar hook protein flgE [Ruegeria sp. TM1040]MDF9304191.1 flagellar hook-basal body complex protein [Tritonibacter mobilis]
MTISSSLNAGVAGLAANSTRLAAISDNIANSSTAGYKRVVTSFESMVISQSGGRYAAGGVSVNNTRMIDERSSLISTSNATDLAVAGRGFLPVASLAEVKAGEDPNMLLTTSGSFRTNDEGYLTTSSGLVLLGWPANSDGTLPSVARDTDDPLEPIRFDTAQLSAAPTTAVSLGVNLPASSAVTGAAGAAEENTIQYFDNLGGQQDLNIVYTPTGAADNEWTMTLTDGVTGTVVGDYTLTFDDSVTGKGTLSTVTTTTGGAYDPATGAIIVTTDSGPIEIEIGVMTQLASSFSAATIEKDGYEAASFAGVEVDEGGYVHALYENGSSRIVYQIPLADMPNANGMRSLDSQTFMPSPDSGAYYLWDAGAGPTGTVASYRQEESGTDVASELTTMIQTQRAYSSNAKVIQTVDEMLQETTNIKR